MKAGGVLKPLIGVPLINNGNNFSYHLNNAYAQSIQEAGGIPILFPIGREEGDANQMISNIHGLLMPGGPDVSPILYGEEPRWEVTESYEDADVFQIKMIKMAYAKNIPVFGICRGIQLINVAFGGSLWQDIKNQTDSEICHMQDVIIRDGRTHTIEISQDSILSKIMGKNEVLVNSFHHQAVKDLADGFKVTARTKDGIIEAMELEDKILAVQWHPEALSDKYPDNRRLFEYFIKISKDNIK